jgi:protein ImuB
LLLGGALNEICGRLSRQSMAAAEIRLTLDLLSKPMFGRVLQLPFATRDARALTKLLQLDLEAHPPAAPVKAMTLELTPVEQRVVQGDLYEPPKPEPEKLELTLGKIRAMVGEPNVGSPRLLNTHRRDAWEIVSMPPGPSLVVDRQPHGRLQLAFRYWRPPVLARVEVQDGMPRRVSSRAVRGTIEQAAGPWRSSGDWWTTEAWEREEWDIGITGGALYRLVRVIAMGEWVLEGSYD